MRFGFALPQIGSPAGPEALVRVAKRAEDLGFDERFIEQIDERIRAEREIEAPGPRATFANLLHWMAESFGVKEKELVAAVS
jgi:hypothetical protein